MAAPATAAESRRKAAIKAPDINPKYTIRKPFGDRFLMLDFYHLDVLGGDRNLTAVFDALLYFSNGKVKSLNGREDRKSEPWFEASEAQLRYRTGGISEKTIRGNVSILVEKGFLKVREGDISGYRVTHQYLVNYEAMDRAVDRYFPIGSFTDGDSKPIGSFTDDPSVVLPTAIGSFTDIYKEEEVKEYIQEKNTEENLPFPSQDQSQNQLPLSTEESLLAEQTPLIPPAAPCEEKYSESQSISYDLQLDEPLLEFVANAYRQSRGAKVTNAELKRAADKLESMEASVGPEEFRTSLWIYLNTSTDTLRKGKWPIWYFIKYPPTVATPPATQSPRPMPTSTSSEPPANAPEQFEAGSTQAIPDPLKNPLTYIEQWNTIVYDSSVDVDAVPSFTMAGLKKAINGGDFQKCFERVFEKCQRMNTNKPDTVTFDGLFMGYVPMWQEIYAGKHDWKMGKEDPFASVLAAAEREERGGL